MRIVLLERVPNLGQMGDVVEVKPGYARNFLLPRRKALRASKENLAYFESQKAELEASNLKKRTEAEDVAKRLDKTVLVMIRQAGESGHLYGSVSSKDIAEGLAELGVKIERSQIRLGSPIKELGIFEAVLHLHPEVDQKIFLNVALSEEEASAQKDRFDRGEEVRLNEDETAA